MIAQGKAKRAPQALPQPWVNDLERRGSPVRATHMRVESSAIHIALLELEFILRPVPRAAPWAIIFWPFRPLIAFPLPTVAALWIGLPVTSSTLIEKCCFVANPVAGNPTHYLVEQAFAQKGL